MHSALVQSCPGPVVPCDCQSAFKLDLTQHTALHVSSRHNAETWQLVSQTGHEITWRQQPCTQQHAGHSPAHRAAAPETASACSQPPHHTPSVAEVQIGVGAVVPQCLGGTDIRRGLGKATEKADAQCSAVTQWPEEAWATVLVALQSGTCALGSEQPTDSQINQLKAAPACSILDSMCQRLLGQACSVQWPCSAVATGSCSRYVQC